jgi:putative ABC transport system ATP-binding protein
MTIDPAARPDYPLVVLRGLRRVYREGERERTVLDGLDLDVQAGEHVALLGRSGSGKSTLLNLISGIDLPDAGEVVIAGENLTLMTERARTLFRRRHIGFVYQFFNLIPTLSVAENVALPLELNGHARDAAEIVHQWLAEVGLSGRADSFPDCLSGGEQQRVALARALVHAPSLVLADEPTGNLDAENGRHVLGLLERLVSESGTTLLLVTHARAVSRIADRVLTLEAGRLGSHAAERMEW